MADADAPDEPAKPDLRFTKQEDRSVHIDRDMSGQGHLARGSHTRMSNIRFSMQAKPRDYLDPELAALHTEPPKPKHVQRAEAEAAVEAAAPAEPDGAAASVKESSANDVSRSAGEALPSMAGRIAQAFRRFISGQ